MRTIVKILLVTLTSYLFVTCLANAQGLHSTALGFGTTAPSFASFVVGSFNRNPTVFSATNWLYTDPLFVIGNGQGADKPSTAFTVLKNGYVGIGISTPPSERLEVSDHLKLFKANSNSNHSPGLIFVSNDDFRFEGRNLNNYGLGAYSKGNSTELKLYLSGFYGLNFFTGGENRMTINKDGNIGIGTSLTLNSPNYKLAVNGTIGAKKIIVEITSNAWSDFVFEKNYNLKSLSEIEKYILANKHLPEIPSANEIEKTGLNLGELIKLQMQKIEELTLYIIEQNKRIEALEKTITK